MTPRQLQSQSEWFDQDVDSIINSLSQGFAAEIRRFNRNAYTKEIEFETLDQLRKKYMGLSTSLVQFLGSEKAVRILEECLKPSYLMQKKRFEVAEV